MGDVIGRITREKFGEIVEEYKSKGLLESNGGYTLMGCNISLFYSAVNSQGGPYNHIDVIGVIPSELAEGFMNMTEGNPDAIWTNNKIASDHTLKKPFPDKGSNLVLAPNSLAAMCSEEEVDQKSLSQTYGSTYIQGLPIDSEEILRLFLSTTMSYYETKSRELSKVHTKE